MIEVPLHMPGRGWHVITHNIITHTDTDNIETCRGLGLPAAAGLAWPPRRTCQGSGFRVSGFGFRVQGSGFRVSGFGATRCCWAGLASASYVSMFAWICSHAASRRSCTMFKIVLGWLTVLG
jgi:hypothetical protein